MNASEGAGTMAGTIFGNFRTRVLMHTVLAALLLQAAGGWFGPVVSGYVLDGRHVIELMLDRIDLPEGLKVSQSLTLFSRGSGNASKQLKQTDCYKMPGFFRSQIEAGDFHKIYLVSEGRSLTVVDGVIVSRSGDEVYHYHDLFSFPRRGKLVDHLRLLGLNAPLSSYGRWENKPVYVIGARYPDQNQPQLWVDKESFLPVRWIFREGSGSSGIDRLEFRYLDWKRHAGVMYPGLVKFFKNGRLVRRIEVKSVEVNPVFPDGFFSIDRLRASCRKPESGSPGVSEQDDIDRQLEEFREIFETE